MRAEFAKQRVAERGPAESPGVLRALIVHTTIALMPRFPQSIFKL